MSTPGLLAAGVAASLSVASVLHAAAQERSLDEIKKEVMRRAGHINPFEGIRREDAAVVVNSLTSLDPDLWAQLWCRIGLAYEGKGDANTSERAELHTLAPTIAALPDTRSRAHPARRKPTGIRCACFARRRSISSPRCKSWKFLSKAGSSSAICRSHPTWRSRRWSCIGAGWAAGRRIASAPAVSFTAPG
jgi:hypothetical protein